MQIFELILDENNIETGVNAISIVEDPAIESNFVALSKDKEYHFAEMEKQILLGPALIPNKTIYRRSGADEFYVFFSEETVRTASQLFLKNSNQSKSTLEHEMKLSGLTVVESWIVDDPEKDKSAFYGLSVPKGTWMVSVKVDNEEVWNNYVKTGKVKGFSIEGYFADKVQMAKEEPSKLEKLREHIKSLL